MELNILQLLFSYIFRLLVLTALMMSSQYYFIFLIFFFIFALVSLQLLL